MHIKLVTDDQRGTGHVETVRGVTQVQVEKRNCGRSRRCQVRAWFAWDARGNVGFPSDTARAAAESLAERHSL